MPKMHQNTFGSRAPTGELMHSPGSLATMGATSMEGGREGERAYF